MQVVIGAGPAGLAAARALRARGHDVLVLEASDRVGGPIAAVPVGGVLAALGPRRIDPSASELVGGLVAVEVRRRPELVHLAGRWVPHPTSLLGLRRLPPGRAAGALARAALGRARGRPGGSIVERLAGPALAAKAHGVDATSVADATPPTLGVGTALGASDGPSALAGALADGIRVETGRRVTRLIEHPDRVIVGLSDGRVATATHVHAGLPPWEVAAMLGLHAEPRPPRSRAVVSVLLLVDGPGDDAVRHLPDPNLLPLRVSRTGTAAGRSVLCAEVPCWPGDDVWTAPDDALVRRVADDLVRAGLPDPRPLASRIERVAGVLVAPTAAALAAAARAERALTLSARVTVLGRPGLDPVDDVVRDLELGEAAARGVDDDGTVDHEVWRTTVRRFRSDDVRR